MKTILHSTVYHSVLGYGTRYRAGILLGHGLLGSMAPACTQLIVKKVPLKILHALCTRVKIDFGVLVMQTDKHVYHCGYCHRLWYFQPITFIENTALKVYILSNKFLSMLSSSHVIIKQGNIILDMLTNLKQPYTNGNSLT